MPQLRIVEGPGQGFVLKLDKKRATLGRDSTNAIKLEDAKASRIHCEITFANKRYTLRDLNSSNGIWDDNGSIEQQELSDGYIFRIGHTYIRYEAESAEEVDQTIAYAEDDFSWDMEGLDSSSVLFTSSVIQDPIIREAHDCLVLLHEVVLRSHEVKTRDELFEILDDVAADALEGERCAVFLPTPDDWALWPPHERRLRARFGSTPFAGTLLRQVRKTQEPMLCTIGGDVDPSSSMMQAGVRSAMAAPIRIGEELQALIYVDRLDGDKPFSRVQLEFLHAVANQLAIRLYNCDHVAELEAEVERLQQDEQETQKINLIGSDPSMDTVFQFIEKAAPTDAPILVTGASGTGKELVARSIHQQSKRNTNVLQVINCAAIAESLIESALFGHVKGAFTGADETRPGLFELADQGTLFLDEVGELPMSVQAKLLRALEQGEVQRVGEGSVRQVDVRILAATNRNLEEEIKAGNFREDLYHRLNVLSVHIPPLSDRPKDIDTLIDHFLHESANRLSETAKTFSPEARALLLRYSWPGNVRQLRNTIERVNILAAGKVIEASDLPDGISGGEDENFNSPIAPLADVEKMHILRVLDHCGGNKKATAEVLGIDRSTLYAKLRQYKVI